MNVTQLTLSSDDPVALGEWYNDALNVDVLFSDGAAIVSAGSTEMILTDADKRTAPYHVAFRSQTPVTELYDWFTDRGEHISVEGESTIRFEFLSADAVYFEDPEGNILECLHYDRDTPKQDSLGPNTVHSVTEVGLPAHDTASLQSWLVDTVGLSTIGSPTETFAWVGDFDSRFVVVPAGRDWYPTDRPAGVSPLTTEVAVENTECEVYESTTHPYTINKTSHTQRS
ncbi:hypothetical protein HUB97_11805 [Halorubraceae archaeon YAN]|nr:hypothetical protein [Halorubraceae archaeon YAN]